MEVARPSVSRVVSRLYSASSSGLHSRPGTNEIARRIALWASDRLAL